MTPDRVSLAASVGSLGSQEDLLESDSPQPHKLSDVSDVQVLAKMQEESECLFAFTTPPPIKGKQYKCFWVLCCCENCRKVRVFPFWSALLQQAKRPNGITAGFWRGYAMYPFPHCTACEWIPRPNCIACPESSPRSIVLDRAAEICWCRCCYGAFTPDKNQVLACA